jgi:predicted acylesterase/phospholipase RssA
MTAHLEEADMVMKGGITSGVMYPLAVQELAKRYRFCNLGGSSAGGIAAAFAAAAEMNRDGGGFDEMAALAADLGPRLAGLFQPSDGTRGLHSVLLAAIDTNRKRKVDKAAGVAQAVVRNATGGFAAGTAALFVPLLLARARGKAIGLAASAVLGGGIGAVIQLARDGLRGLGANGYGLCRGSAGTAWPEVAPPEDGPTEPFTDWMHAAINRIAGYERGEVLTAGHLWGKEAVDAYAAAIADGLDVPSAIRRAKPAIRLEMMTTNVTHCRPARLPLESRMYLYCEKELAEYFPPPVIEHLRATGDEPSEATECPRHRGVQLRHLPAPPDFPVIAMVRMTLSFPGLISAVPLHAVDYTYDPPVVTCCWFSDGGVSSNFPIHFFDAMWPRRPTFGISLAPYHPQKKDEHVYFPAKGEDRKPRVRDTSTLGGFVSALLDTLQNWSDEGQATLPGYRDRIVEIHHTEAEGGMNLLMPKEVIESLMARGVLAAKALENFDFDRHRWSRYLTAMAELDRAVCDLTDRYEDVYRDFVESYGPQAATYDHSPAWVASALTRTERLLSFARRPKEKADFTAPKAAPRPRPELRMTPRF